MIVVFQHFAALVSLSYIVLTLACISKLLTSAFGKAIFNHLQNIKCDTYTVHLQGVKLNHEQLVLLNP